MNNLKTVFDMRRFILRNDITLEKRDQFGASKGSVQKHGYGYLAFIDHNLSTIASLHAARHELIHIFLGHADDEEKSKGQKEAEVKEFIQKHPAAFNPEDIYEDLISDYGSTLGKVTVGYMTFDQPLNKGMDPLVKFFMNPKAKVFNAKGDPK